MMQVVVLTPRHRLTGEMNLRNQRLSDFLNDRLESVIRLDNASVSRASEPDAPVERRTTAVIHKRDALVVYGIDDQNAMASQRLYARVQKRTHEVLLVVDTIEVRGSLHTTEALDAAQLQRLVTSPGAFLPITGALVNIDGVALSHEALMVNIQQIRFVAKIEGEA